VFKPSKQIEFDRTGEVTLYTSTPFRTKDIYFPYPHCMAYTMAPFFGYMFLINPMNLMWYYNNAFLFAAIGSFIPHSEYLFGLRYYINKLTLLRGGTVLAVHHSNVTGLKWKTWIFIDEINLLTEDKQLLEEDKGINAKVVGEDGSLNYETHFQVDHFVDCGRNMEDQVLMLLKEGTVHEPELLEAALKGFEIDTSNYRINTLHVERFNEPDINI
jgi:hypothetical protein